MNSLRAFRLIVLAMFGATCAIGTASATDYTRVIDCANCSTPYAFKQAAVTDNLSVEAEAVYIVVGGASNHTAYVRVTGNYWPDGYGGYVWYPTGNLVDEYGVSLSTNTSTAMAQMAVIDSGIYGYIRTASTPSVTTVNVSSTYSGSFIGSDDSLDGPGVSHALGLLGRNPATFPIGYKLLVVFPDGTKAGFVKVCQCTAMWVWDGVRAWNAQGKQITNRSGALKTNNFSTGGASGSSSYITTAVQPYTGLDVGWYFLLWGQGQCVGKTSYSTVADGILAEFEHYVPCW